MSVRGANAGVKPGNPPMYRRGENPLSRDRITQWGDLTTLDSARQIESLLSDQKLVELPGLALLAQHRIGEHRLAQGCRLTHRIASGHSALTTPVCSARVGQPACKVA